MERCHATLRRMPGQTASAAPSVITSCNTWFGSSGISGCLYSTCADASSSPVRLLRQQIVYLGLSAILTQVTS